MTDPEDKNFWLAADKLISTSEIIIDRPAGSRHPRYPAMIYPLDYGYLVGTSSGDGNEIDIWQGSMSASTVTAAICLIDMVKRDSEIKLLIGCTESEIRTIAEFHNGGGQARLLQIRPQF